MIDLESIGAKWTFGGGTSDLGLGGGAMFVSTVVKSL